MTLGELKKKTLVLIEEYNPNSEYLSDDPDIVAKFNDVTNQIIFELARIKKIPKYVELEVSAGDTITFYNIESKCNCKVYQINLVSGVEYISKANGTVFKILETGTAEIDCFVYPEIISNMTQDSHEFELSRDALEIAPYGIAADLLKSDVSAEYGNVYATRYESMKQMLDPRYQMTSVYIEGGIDI